MKMEQEADQVMDRRPLKSRSVRAFQRMAGVLAARRISPNFISVLSLVFAGGAAICLWATAHCDGWLLRACWLAAAALVQLRLLANMLDGMVAVASGRTSRLGDLYNEVPDRVSDTIILVALGWAAGGSPALGFLAALIALFVAYVRLVGAAVGTGHDFCGPLAKPQRMFFVTLLALYCAAAPAAWQPSLESGEGLAAACLLLIIVGGALTALRRLIHIATAVRAL